MREKASALAARLCELRTAGFERKPCRPNPSRSRSADPLERLNLIGEALDRQ
jgi:hypothetical protein